MSIINLKYSMVVGGKKSWIVNNVLAAGDEKCTTTTI